MLHFFIDFKKYPKSLNLPLRAKDQKKIIIIFSSSLDRKWRHNVAPVLQAHKVNQSVLTLLSPMGAASSSIWSFLGRTGVISKPEKPGGEGEFRCFGKHFSSSWAAWTGFMRKLVACRKKNGTRVMADIFSHNLRKPLADHNVYRCIVVSKWLNFYPRRKKVSAVTAY